MTCTVYEPVEWSADGCPRSPRFQDVYRARAGGLAQAKTVFLGGCGLPQGWSHQRDFTVLETGFGLGLNFLATWAAWARDPVRCPALHYVAIEAYPVAAADIRHSVRALPPTDRAELPELAALADALADAWQQLRPGVQTLAFADGRLRLSLAVGDVQDMLAQLRVVADAVYLDGFSPALNPRMWSADTLAALARHCRPGTRLATYSTAPQVRSALADAGFSVWRCKGLAPKRHRLQACWGSADPAMVQTASQ